MGRLEHIAVIDQLRGLAALSVAWFHLTSWSGGWVAGSGAWGSLGVEAFFVISGFTIPYALARTQSTYGLADFPSFMARRLVRLEPPYIASIVLVIVLNSIAASSPMFRGAPPAYEPVQVFAHLLYLVPLTEFQWIQPVYWSLAWEFVFYLVIGLIFPVVGFRQHRRSVQAIVAVAVLLVAAGAISHLALLFIMGFAVYRRVALSDELSPTIALIGASAFGIAISGGWASAGVGAVTAAIIFFHSALPIVGGRFGAALVGLGTISYSLYLLHVPIGGKVVNFGLRFLDGGPARFALSVAALMISVATAIIFWKLIEHPSIKAAGKLRDPARAPESAAL